MGNPLKRLSQLGIESTVLTPTAADVQLAGKLSMKHMPNRRKRDEARNSMGGSNTRDDMSIQSQGTYAGDLSAAELVYWLSLGMRGDPTVTTPETSVRKHVYLQMLATIPDLKYATVYWGDDSGALRAPGAFVTQIVVEGADDGPWTIRCALTGGGVIAGTFASLSTITHETVKNLLTLLFVEDSWTALDATTVGTVASPGSERRQLHFGFTWTHNTGNSPTFTTDGTLSRSAVDRTEPSTTLQLRTRHHGLALTEEVNWINNTRQFIRLLNVGGLVGATAKNTIQIDGAYDFVDFDSVADERDGVVRSTWDLEAVEDTSRMVEVTVINGVIPPL